MKCLHCDGTGKEPVTEVVDGASCKALREALGLEQREVAKAARVDPGTLSKMERGLLPWTGPATKRLTRYFQRRMAQCA